MRNNNPKLTEMDVLKQAKEDLGEHLKLKAEGYVCTTEQVLHILLGVAAVMPQLIGVLHNSDIENKSLTALLPQLTEALRGCE